LAVKPRFPEGMRGFYGTFFENTENAKLFLKNVI